MYLQTTSMLSVRKLYDVAENWVLMFELLVGGNLHIFCNPGVSNRISRWLHRLAVRFCLIEFKMDSLSLPLCNKMTRKLLTFLLCGFLYTKVLHF